jgi:hypothetical protein
VNRSALVSLFSTSSSTMHRANCFCSGSVIKKLQMHMKGLISESLLIFVAVLFQAASCRKNAPPALHAFLLTHVQLNGTGRTWNCH